MSASSPASEVITVKAARVACDGGGGALGHPKVYLQIKPEVGDVACPYCSRRFILSGDGADSGSGH